MPAPLKLAHVVYRSNDMPRLRDWYLRVLEAEVAFENDGICFLTYDEEHHRIAILAGRDYVTARGAAGVDHVAFAYADLPDLLETHERLRTAGIEPYWTVNHGPTTSLYYRDPDANRIELQVDNYPSTQELHDFFRSEHFSGNPIGLEIDVDGLRRRLDAGEPEAQVLLRADVLASSA